MDVVRVIELRRAVVVPPVPLEVARGEHAVVAVLLDQSIRGGVGHLAAGAQRGMLFEDLSEPFASERGLPVQ